MQFLLRLDSSEIELNQGHILFDHIKSQLTQDTVFTITPQGSDNPHIYPNTDPTQSFNSLYGYISSITPSPGSNFPIINTSHDGVKIRIVRLRESPSISCSLESSTREFTTQEQ